MYPSGFALTRPDSLPELLQARQEAGISGALYAGGTELILAMKMGMLTYDVLIDTKRVPEMGVVSVDDHELRIGGAVTHRSIQEHPAVGLHIPELCRLLSQVGNLRVRSAGTLAGNIAFAEPHADPPALLVALGARVELAKVGGVRALPISEFLVGAYETALEDSEVITAIHVPLPDPNTRVTYARFKNGERPMVTVAIAGAVGQGRFLSAPEIVLGAVDETPRRVETGDLEGLSVSDRDAVYAVARRVHDVIRPTPDGLGSIEYKHHIAEVLTRRTLMSISESSE